MTSLEYALWTAYPADSREHELERLSKQAAEEEAAAVLRLARDPVEPVPIHLHDYLTRLLEAVSVLADLNDPLLEQAAEEEVIHDETVITLHRLSSGMKELKADLRLAVGDAIPSRARDAQKDAEQRALASRTADEARKRQDALEVAAQIAPTVWRVLDSIK